MKTHPPQNQEEIAKVPVGTLALIAATLAGPDMKAHECVIKAYEILEAATHGQKHLANPEDFWSEQQQLEGSGVVLFLRHHYEGPAAEPDWEQEYPAYRHLALGVDGTPVPVPFDQALKAIDPKPGKVANRLPRFRQWLMDKYRLTVIDAGDRIAEWKKDGIPFDHFERALDSFPKWRKWRTSNERKAAAEKSRQAKKGKQGRVKSKTDKRTGARPDREKFKKAIGAS